MVTMDFWHAYTSTLSKPEFGTTRSLTAAMERNTASLNAVSQRAIKLEIDSSIKTMLDPIGKRYVISDNITFDIVVSIYDINSTNALVFRTAKNHIEKSLQIAINKFAKGIKKPNFELRCIGLQNGSKEAANIVSEMHNIAKGSIAEIDLFGSEIRHICIDLKTGLTYDLLLENRRYRAAELTNKMTKPEFDAKIGNVSVAALSSTSQTNKAGDSKMQ